MFVLGIKKFPAVAGRVGIGARLDGGGVDGCALGRRSKIGRHEEGSVRVASSMVNTRILDPDRESPRDDICVGFVDTLVGGDRSGAAALGTGC